MPRTHIIVPTDCVDLDGLLNCLVSIQGNTNAYSRICLVANGVECGEWNSTDAWAELHDRQPQALAAILPKRIGYVNAVNLGFRLLEEAGMEDDDYLCVLHDDIEVQGDFLTPLREALDRGAAQVGPSLRTLDAHGEYRWYLEGWCWAAKVRTIRGVMPPGAVYDSTFAPGSWADADLSIAIQAGSGRVEPISVPIQHLLSGNGRFPPYWNENRDKLIQKWRL